MKARTLLGICGTCLLLTVSSAAVAQEGRPAGRRADAMNRGRAPALPDSTEISRMVDEMTVALSLTADQKQAISDLHFAHFAQLAQVRAQMSTASGTREGQREKMDALRTEFERQLKAQLNQEQLEKFEKLARNHGPRGRQPGPRRN